MKILIRFILVIILVLGLTTYTGCSNDDANNSTSITNSSEKYLSETPFTESNTTQVLSYEISEDSVFIILEKAEELYKSSDGINGYKFQKVGNKYYENGDVNKPTYEDIIAEYHEIFTDDVCQQIFSGKRKKGNTEYEIIPAYGFSSDGDYIELAFSEDSTTYKNCAIIDLFSVVRGMDMNYIEHYFNIKEITNNKITISCIALYSKNPAGFNLSLKYENDNWIIKESENAQQIGSIYKLSSYEYTQEYFYSLILENGKWKLENFELWY